MAKERPAIEPAQVVARYVLAVPAELDPRAPQRAAVHARVHALGDLPGAQPERSELAPVDRRADRRVFADHGIETSGGSGPPTCDARRVEEVASEAHLAQLEPRACHDLAQQIVAALRVARRAAVHRRVEQRLVLLDRRRRARDELVALEFAPRRSARAWPPSFAGWPPCSARRRRSSRTRGPARRRWARAAAARAGAPRARSRRGRRRRDRCRAARSRPSRAAGEVAADERAPDEQLDRLRGLMPVARRGSVGPLERALRRLRGAEPVEHAREHALHPRARVAALRAARLHELLERLGQRRARRGRVALVARHVAHRAAGSRRGAPGRAPRPARTARRVR